MTTTWKMPANACDAHLHIIDPRFAPAQAGTVVPAGRSLADYARVQEALGLQRAVIVQSKLYGTDNRCLLDALAQLRGRGRGIAVVDPSISDDHLQTLHEAGVRGLRFSLWKAADQVVQVEDIGLMAARIAQWGWHVQIHMAAEQIVAQQRLLTGLPVPVVFDHLGRLPPGGDSSHPAFAFIAGLIEADRAWVKLSGAYLNTAVGGPDYPDAGVIARAFARLAPQRVVWGSDWPHVTEAHAPDDAGLLGLLQDWVPDEAQRTAVLVDNPARLYGFN
jgi:predicted TIM-barrel fold metal-dependent hydrolase